MAKLSAHGFELARVARETDYDAPEGSHDPVWTRYTWSFRSDGYILEKQDTRWKDGMKHCYGWKLHKRLKNRPGNGKSPERAQVMRDFIVGRVSAGRLQKEDLKTADRRLILALEELKTVSS